MNKSNAAEKKPVAPRTKKAKDTTQEKLPEHVLIRVRSEDGQTIKVHGDIISQKGSAILGKIGQSLSAAFIKSLNEQISRNVETYLFLTIREGWNGEYVTYQCLLKNVSAELDKTKIDLVPEYYSVSYKDIKTWFEISAMGRMTRDNMNRIFVFSSDRPIMSVIKSTAAVFRVGLRK
jgi:hypothetical protein